MSRRGQGKRLRIPKGVNTAKGLLGDVSTLQWTISGFMSIAAVIWALISDQPPPLIAFLGLCVLAIVLVITHVVRLSIEDWRERSIPIAFADIRRTAFNNYPMRGRPANPGEFDEAVAFAYGLVTIANISASRSATLNIFLHLTTDDGWDVKLPASLVGAFGHRLDQDAAIVPILANMGLAAPVYLENPIHLKAGDAITRNLVFMFEAFDSANRTEFLMRVVNQPQFEERLVVSDLVSGLTLTLPIPASYRGKGD